MYLSGASQGWIWDLPAVEGPPSTQIFLFYFSLLFCPIASTPSTVRDAWKMLESMAPWEGRAGSQMPRKQIGPIPMGPQCESCLRDPRGAGPSCFCFSRTPRRASCPRFHREVRTSLHICRGDPSWPALRTWGSTGEHRWVPARLSPLKGRGMILEEVCDCQPR